jgi:hypothetical protein
MDLADAINNLLDELNVALNNNADQIKIAEIKKELDSITHQGERAENLFTNDYYVNNMMLDRREKQMQ